MRLLSYVLDLVFNKPKLIPSIMQPILSNEILMNVPKLVLGQFCRGTFMEYTCNVDWPCANNETSVNLQEIDFWDSKKSTYRSLILYTFQIQI